MWRSRLASRVSVSLLPSRPSRRAEHKHRSLPRFAASRRWSCCLPRRRRRWTRLCGRSSQRHPPRPPRSHLFPSSSSSHQRPSPPPPARRRRPSGPAGPGRAGPDVVRPSRAGCGPAGQGWAGFCFATSPQLHRHANRRRRRPSDAAEEELNPRAGAAPQNRIKFAFGLMIVCSRQKRFAQSSM